MSHAEPAPDCPLWRFSLRIYGAAPVQQACLSLQARHGLDVNLVLACAWLGARGCDPDASRGAIKRAFDSTRALHREVIVPLRGSRSTLKPLLDELPEAVRDRAAALRDRVKQVELELERLEQELLYDALHALPAGSQPATPALPGRHLAHYLRLVDVQLDDESQRAFDAVAHAALAAR